MRRRKKQRLALKVLLFAVSATFLVMLTSPSSALATSDKDTITGHVYILGTSPPTPISGIIVTLTVNGNPACNPFGACPVATTQSDGSYALKGSIINGLSTYVLGFNGGVRDMPCTGCGVAVNALYDQWVESVTTNSNGNANYDAYLPTSSQVWVPGAAVYSDTPFAAVTYETSQTYSNKHTLGFSIVGGPITAGIGYDSASGETIFTSFGASPNTALVYTELQYGLAFYCDDQAGTGFCNSYYGGTGIRSVGFSPTIPHQAWGTKATAEGLSPASLPTSNYVDFSVGANTSPQLPFKRDYYETQTTTLEANLNIAWNVFGSGITVATSATAESSASSNYGIGYQIWNTDPVDHFFRAYPVFDDPNHVAGNEMHVWDVSPNTPSTPNGPTYVYIYYSYSYSTSATDPNGLSLEYKFDWGDGSTTTTGWYASGTTATASHWWGNGGYYQVRVQAYNGIYWSAWSGSLTVDVTGAHCPPVCSPQP